MYYYYGYDLNKPAFELLLDLIYISNGIRFTPNELTVGTPEELDQRPDIDYDPNTFIRIFVNPDDDNRYYGNTGVMYRRGNLLEVPPVTPGTLVPTPSYPFTTLDLLPAINTYYAVQLTEADVENTTYASAEDPLVITFLPTSLCWTGVATLNNPLVEETDLSGFLEYVSS